MPGESGAPTGESHRGVARKNRSEVQKKGKMETETLWLFLTVKEGLLAPSPQCEQ